MRRSGLLHERAITLVLLLLVVSPIPIILTSTLSRLNLAHLYSMQASDEMKNGVQDHPIKNTVSPLETWAASDSGSLPDAIQGVLRPVSVEQSGYSSTGNVTVRTDTSTNTQRTLTIDTSHNWIASQAEINVTNLERLYVVNGTFDEGYPGYTVNPNGTLVNYPFGWSATSTNGDATLEQTQEVSYEQGSEQYVTAQNKAKLTNPGQKQYTHYANTKVLWNQTFENTPYTNQFLLSFRYILLQGPLNSTLSGTYTLKAFVEGTQVTSVNLPTLSQKGTWFETGVIPVSLAVPSGAVSFTIGLVIDSTFVVSANNDYDGDGIADGIANTQYIKVCIDDVNLIGATPPSCENINLQFSVNGVSTQIAGASGSGTGIITNESHWTLSPLTIELSSNTSVSASYIVRLLNHRFVNSSASTSTLQTGVYYTINYNQSASLELYTYLGILGLYDNLVIRIYHPVDWENFTVLDSFLTDVTSSCTLDSEYLTIPTILLDRLGWWKVLCESKNYAHGASIESYDIGTTNWVNESVFHSGDSARASIMISSGSFVPLLSDPVNFTWIQPNSTLWHESSTISGSIGSAISAQVSFGSMNTTAGSWGLTYQWTNGSELAYSYVKYSLHHQAALEVVLSENLDTVVGQPVTVVLRFYDTENGMFLLNDGAEVIGTWAAGVVDFEPNIVLNWWQADFDTALVGAGDFDVSITSAAPYFETTPLVITIRSQFVTSVVPPQGPLQPLIYGREYSFDYFYFIEYNGTGVGGASVDVSGEGSQWTSITDEGNGHYLLSLTPLGLGFCSISITFSKAGYHVRQNGLSFLVNKVPIEVKPMAGFSGPESQLIDIEVNVTEADTHRLVSNANVSLSILTGGTTYAEAEMNEITPGVYRASIVMPPSGSSTYSASITVEKENFEMVQEASFALVPTFDASAKLIQTIVTNSPQILLFAGLIGAVVAGQKYYSRKRRRVHALARNIKMRFDDANNLLGVIVLHKLSGLPIYSKILKGGLEEGMLSAFITAIMHFRAEFDRRREKDDYTIIPISDVVRSVPTENLICAFITITSASKAQEEKMINYARAIGMMLDESLSERPAQVVDAKTVKTFEWMFDDFVDGVLLRPYQIGEKRLPKKLRHIEEVVNTPDGVESFQLVNLIRLLETCGIDEDEAYLLVMDAIEQEYIVPIYTNNNSKPEVMDE